MNTEEKLEERAIELVIAQDASGRSEAEIAAEDEWLAADPRHRRAYLRMLECWTSADALRELLPADGTINADITLPTATANADIALPAAAADAQAFPREQRSGLNHRSMSFAVYGLVAFAALVLVIGSIAFYMERVRGWQVYHSSATAQQVVELGDGSVVTLDKSTDLRVRFTDSIRELELLVGEALFKVAHERAREFVVTAAGQTMSAVGTEFSVRVAAEKTVEVFVKQGAVQVGSARVFSRPKPPPRDGTSNPREPLLSEGDVYTFIDGVGSVGRVSDGFLRAKFASLEGETVDFVFKGETLAQAVELFNSQNSDVQMRVLDAQAAAVRVNGQFDPMDPRAFATAIARVEPVSVETERPGEILLRYSKHR